MQEAHDGVKGCTTPYLEGEGFPYGYVGQVGRIGEILSSNSCGEEIFMSISQGSIH